MTMRYITLILLAVAAVGCKAQGVMTLKECIETGLRNNAELNAASMDLEIASVGIRQQKARRLPTVGGTVQMLGYIDRPANVTTGTLLGNDFPDKPTWNAVRTMRYNDGVAVQANVPLLDLTISAGIQVAKMSGAMAKESYEKRRRDLIMQIANVYYLMQSTERQVCLTDENLQRMTEIVAITKAKHDEGEVLETDYTRAEVNLKQLATLKDAYATALANQKNLMQYLMGVDTSYEIQVMSYETDSVLSPDTHSLSLTTNPTLRLAEMQKDIIGLQIAQTKRGYLPTIALQGQLGAIGYHDEFGQIFHSNDATHGWFGNTYLALSVRVPIFDANTRRLQIRKARWQQEQSAWRIKQVESKLKKEYADAVETRRYSLATYDTQREACRQAADILTQATERYNEGLASMTELLQDEMALRTAQTDCTSAVYNYRAAELKLLELSDELETLYK